MALYGLIGHPLSHSFSKKYFENKFKDASLSGNEYQLFDIDNIGHLPDIIAQNPNLKGLNVTIPYKEAVIKYLDYLDESARKVGAVNVIKIDNGHLSGYNSDYYGFEKSLLEWFPDAAKAKAVILGTGGASKAVMTVLGNHQIPFTLVSRTKSSEAISYDELNNSSIVSDSQLIINTTPLGMSPNLDGHPDINYEQLTGSHYVSDLIYNPEETAFLKKAYRQGAKIKNGYEMLELQAEKSWDIWTS